MQRLGIVITKPRPPNHLGFHFMLDAEVETSVGTFVEIPSGTLVFVGKITEIQAQNIYYENLNFVQSLLSDGVQVADRYMTETKNYRHARVKILSVVKNTLSNPPEIPPDPGESVYPISQSTLSYVFDSSNASLTIGVLHGTSLPLSVDMRALMEEHLLVVGSTGSGKTHAAAIVVTGILQKGLPVVVIDTHGEYHSLFQRSLSLANPQLESRSQTDIITVSPQTTTSQPSQSIPFSIQFSALSPEQINEIAGIKGAAEDLIHLAYRDAYLEHGSDFTIDMFTQNIQTTGRHWKFHTNSIVAAVRRLLTLQELGIFGAEIDLLSLVHPGRVIIVDLSIPMRERVRRTVAGHLIRQLFIFRRQNQLHLPVFILIEEAHRFMPRNFSSYSGTMIQQVAREGRKFGVGLGIVTQMTRNLDPITIGQCNTKIILRHNNQTDVEALLPSSDLIDTAETKLLPFIPTGTAYVTGVATRLPVLVDINNLPSSSS
ncbi:MAG: ATP-binding protein [Candidatus Thorarchaeota archaeon]